MKEMLKSYNLEGEYIGDLEKKECHRKMREEFFEKGSSSMRHEHVRVLILTSQGRLILQRRSKWKGDNAGMWDKTIGGHVTGDDSSDLTVLKECAEELGIPATVVDISDFEHTVKITDLHVLGVLTKIAYLDNYQSSRKMTDERRWVEPSKTTFYIGYYDGAIRFIDSESCGIQVFSKEELQEEIENSPNIFTDDAKYILKKFDKLIKPVIDKREHILND